METLTPETKPYFCHESSYVDEPVTIGNGTMIWHFSHILGHTNIGQNCRIGQNVVIGPHVTIGHNVKIQNNVSIYPGVTLEDDVFCGPSMVFTNVLNPRSEFPQNTMEAFAKTRVQKGATIGANATIVCGSTIGKYAFIGAGAVVTRDVPDYALFYGNPAKHHGWMCICGQKLPKFDDKGPSMVSCEPCSRQYQFDTQNQGINLISA